ncbi:transmembrane protein 176B-like [Elgaria multicarinata webbii]|uniref:transmembrane protein 176B-like n=1 Tax=Elgaria multicarinata webbii TaxID=159646 RepID=UPI002FCD5EA5
MGSQEEGAMSHSTVKVNGIKVATEGPGQTVVNVHISQESSLAYLFKAVAAMRCPKPASKAQEFSPAATPRARTGCSGEQKVLGAAQILLGLMCIALGVVISLGLGPYSSYYEDRLIYNGAPFWMGSVCILAGTFSVVGERRSGGWVHLATFFNLASVVAGVVALALGVASVPNMTDKPYYIDRLCQKSRQYYNSWEVPASPSPSESYDAWRVEDCKKKMWQLITIANSVRLLLLIVSVAALGIAIFCLGYGLRVLCRSVRAGCEDYVAITDPEAPPSYEDPEKEGDAA